MFKKLNILDEKDKRLRMISTDITEPLTKKDKELVKQMLLELRYSQIEELSLKYDLRPGMGMAAIQLGIKKRYIVIVHEITEEDDTEQKFDTYVVINPQIISHSEEEICAEVGEGCLSVNRETNGYVKRYARVKIKGFDINGNEIIIRAREELSIAFQHEIDHLNGILFIDKLTNDIEGIRTI